MMKWLTVAIVLLLLVPLALSLLILNVQRGMMFPGTMRSVDPAPERRHPSVEKIVLSIPGAEVEAWFLPAVRPAKEATDALPVDPRPAVIFAHGNGELIDDWPDALAGFPALGLGLLLVEYPGYGRSGGSPSEASIRATMLAADDALTARADVDPQRIVLYGRSLGGGAVTSILDERPPAALILQSSFTSVADLAHEILAVPSWLVRDPMRSLEAVARYRGPTLVIHGRLDEVIPYHHGERLLEAAHDGRMITYACGHNDCPPDWQRFWSDIAGFLRDEGLLSR